VINQNVLELFKYNSWLRRFLCQLTHRWPGGYSSYWSVVSCGLPVIAFVLFLSLFIYGKCHAHYACPRTTWNSSYYFLKLYICTCICKYPQSFVWLNKTKRTGFMKRNDDPSYCYPPDILFFTYKEYNCVIRLQKSAYLTCSRDTREKKIRIPWCSDKNNAKILDGRKAIL
jgi:hypothetical protein